MRSNNYIFSGILLAGFGLFFSVPAFAADFVTVPVLHSQILSDENGRGPVIAPQQVGRVLGADVTVPTVTEIKGKNGTYNVGTERQSVTVQPYRSTYRGRVWARTVNFGPDLGSVSLFAPVDAYLFGDLKVYNQQGHAINVVKPFGRYAKNGVQAAISVDANTNKVFLVIADTQATNKIQTFEVTPLGIVYRNAITVSSVPAKIQIGFLAKEPDVLLTATNGQKKTVRAWRYATRSNAFVPAINVSLQSVRVSSFGIAQ